MAAGTRDGGKEERRGEEGMDGWRDTERMKERQKMQEQKEEQDLFSINIIIKKKQKKPLVRGCAGDLCG